MKAQLKIKKHIDFKQEVKDNAVIYIATLIFLVLNMFLILYHETWLDEIQAWELQKNNNIFEIYSHCKSEGHPMLWYLILKPFTLLGFPLQTMNVISVLFMTLAAYLLLRYIKVNIWVKLLVVFGGQMFYYNAVNARTYSLACLAIVLIMINYSERKEHPYKFNLSLLLLTQTHIITCGFIAGFWIVEVYEMLRDYGFLGSFKKESRDRLYGLLIYSLGIVWLLCQLMSLGSQIAYSNEIVNVLNLNIDQQTLITAAINIVACLPTFVHNAIQSIVYQFGISMQNVNVALSIFRQVDWFYISFQISTIIQIVFFIHLWNVNKLKLFIIYLGVLAVDLISTFITSLNTQRVLVTLFFIFAIQLIDNFTIKKSMDNINKIMQIAIYCVCVLLSIALMCNEIRYQFGLDVSLMREASSYIKDSDTIVQLDEQLGGSGSELAQYITKKPFYNLRTNEYTTYLKLLKQDEEVYEVKGSRGIPSIIEDLFEFMNSNNINPDRLVVPLLSYQELNRESSDFKAVTVMKYFDAQYSHTYYVGEFVVQLPKCTVYILRPNETFKTAYNQYISS